MSTLRLDWERNIGRVDQAVRGILGAGLLILAAAGVVSAGWAAAAAVVGFALLLEAVSRY